jgi:rhamnogalacturonyl hydrolase YesR
MIPMNKKRIIKIASLALLFILPSFVTLDNQPPKQWSVALANTIMTRFPDPSTYPFRSWCYPQGYILMGMDKLWQSTGVQLYYDYIMKFANEQVDEQGKLLKFKGGSMDDMMAGAVIVWAYKQTGLQKFKIAADTIRKSYDTYPRTTDSIFWHGRRTVGQIWVDGVFMGQMFLAKYGKYVGDSKYCFDEAARQIIGMHKHLLKGNSGLLYHAWSEDKKARWANQETGLSPEVWSEGLGWYALVLVETLDIFPEKHPKRAELVKITQDLMQGLKNTQDPKTGLWFQVVDKGEQPDNWHDASGSAMFLYGIQRAIELGIIKEKEYKPLVEKGYKGLLTKLKINDIDGLVDVYDACDGLGVQMSYNAYINYKKRVNAKEAVAGVLWATWIVEKPGKKK